MVLLFTGILGGCHPKCLAGDGISFLQGCGSMLLDVIRNALLVMIYLCYEVVDLCYFILDLVCTLTNGGCKLFSTSLNIDLPCLSALFPSCLCLHQDSIGSDLIFFKLTILDAVLFILTQLGPIVVCLGGAATCASVCVIAGSPVGVATSIFSFSSAINNFVNSMG